MNRFLLLSIILFIYTHSKGQIDLSEQSPSFNQEWVMVKVRNSSQPLSPGTQAIPLRPTASQARRAPSAIDGLCKVKVPEGFTPETFIKSLEGSSNVIYAEPIVNYQLLYVPLDPDNQTSQSYLSLMGAYDAWDLTRGDNDLTIGIIDSGIDLDHEDLQSNLWVNEADPVDGIDNDGNGYIDDYLGYDFADGDPDPSAEATAHGTEVAGLAGAATDNNIGISSIGFNTKIAALKGFRTEGNTANNLYEAIIYAADNGIQILNLSWGAISSGLQSEQDIINYAVLENDMVVVAAGGNTNIDAKFFPASYDHVLSVGATDLSDNRWSLSTYNYSIDLMAPGASVYTTSNDDSYNSGFGTSLSAPLVAGTAALVKSQYPELNALQIMERIRVTTDDIYSVGTNAQFDGKLGSGRLNVFNAVAATNPKSLRVTEVETSTSFGSSFFFGDTVTVSIDLTNYLGTLSSPEIHVSSPLGQFTTPQNIISLPTLNTLSSTSTSFDILINEDIGPSETIDIRLDIYDDGYTDFQFLEPSTAPDHIALGGNLEMTIAGNGNIGFADTLFSDGIGLTFNEQQLLTHGGLLIATSKDSVSDNFISNYFAGSRSEDFIQNELIKYYRHPAVDEFIYSSFSDSLHGLFIEQSAYSQNNSDFILIKYRVTNSENEAINDVALGFYSDFDVVDRFSNRAERVNDYNLTKDSEETLFAGVKHLAKGSEFFSLVDLSNQNSNSSTITDGVFNDSVKFELISNPITTPAGSSGAGNDVSSFVGHTFSTIASLSSEEIWVILAAGESQAELEVSMAEAEELIESINQNPRILETVISCEGVQVTIDPESGDQFRFFEDPLGTQFLAEGTSFTTGTISSDTAIYLQNVDGTFPSEIFQVQISLLEDVAQFTFSPDTLYLDNPTNVVSFQDQSIQPVSWLWDFGQGTTSRIQNPILSFNEAREYTITLEVENEQGCIDSEMQTLVVANRPEAPAFADLTLCPETTTTLEDENEVRVYTSETSINPIASGSNVTIGPFDESTTIYVSSVVNQFESLREPVEITVVPFDLEIDIVPDTLSTEPAFIVSTSNELTTIEWLLDGASLGAIESVEISLENNGSSIQLIGTNADGCTLTETTQVDFSTSPTPSQPDLIVCEGESVLLTPQNGQFFGFYSDLSLSNLIKKGKTLEVNGLEQVFIVGLDDGLAGDATEVSISYDDFQVDADTSSVSLSGVTQVTFTPTSESTIASYEWLVDDEVVESSPNPTLFFGNESYEVVLNAQSANGCAASDTILLDFSPVILGSQTEFLPAYPNPSSGRFIIPSVADSEMIQVLDIKGSEISFGRSFNQIDLSSQVPGIYFIKYFDGIKEHYQKVVLE